MSEIVKIGIVEDEVLISDALIRHLNKIGYSTTIAATNYIEAIEMISQEKPDLVITDIQLTGTKTGIDVGHFLQEQQIPFIYLTAHFDDQTVSKAAVTRPGGYLIKPFRPENLKAALTVALSKSKTKQNKIISVKSGYNYHRIDTSDILYLEADGVYITLYMKNEKVIVRTTMKEMLSTLPAELFVRCHRSYAINSEYITRLEAGFIWVNHIKLPVSRSYREEMIKAIQ
jgi:two-component system response regulator LytT